MHKLIVSIVLIVVLIAGGISVQQWLVATTPQPSRADLQRPPLRVEVVVVEPRTLAEPIIGYGTVRALHQSRVAAYVAGTVADRSDQLKAGTAVRAGDVLLRIDDRDYRKQLERAERRIEIDEATLARLEIEQANIDHLIEIATNEHDIAQREYQRVLGLFEDGQAPRSELDVARQAFERARRALQSLENNKALIPQQRTAAIANRDLHAAERDLARLNLERCQVAAPFDGRVANVLVEVGEHVGPGQPLFTLIDPTRLEVGVELPVSLRDRVRVGAACALTLDSRPGFSTAATVTRLSPEAAVDTRTFTAYVELAEHDAEDAEAVLPGMFLRARVDGPLFVDALLVPRQAILDGQVYVAADGVAHAREITVRRFVLDQAIVAGLRPGDSVITTNLDIMYDGCPVSINAAGDAAEADAPGADAPDAAGGHSDDLDR